jgi:hypothetical protein
MKLELGRLGRNEAAMRSSEGETMEQEVRREETGGRREKARERKIRVPRSNSS